MVLPGQQRNPFRADLCLFEGEQTYGEGIPRVYYIMETYVIPECEKVIAELTGEIMDKSGASLVCVEGAVGLVDTSLFGASPDAQVRESVAREFLERAEINGVEYLSITGKRDFEIWGVDDQSLYAQMLEAIKPLLEEGRSWATRLGDLQACLGREAAGKLSPVLRAFLGEYAEAERGDFKAQIAVLEAWAGRAGVDLAGTRDLDGLLAVIHKEDDIDFGQANVEQQSVVAGLLDRMKDGKTFVQRTLDEVGEGLGVGPKGRFWQWFAGLSAAEMRDVLPRIRHAPLGRLLRYLAQQSPDGGGALSGREAMAALDKALKEALAEMLKMVVGTRMQTNSHRDLHDFVIDLCVLCGIPDGEYANIMRFVHYMNRYENLDRHRLFAEIQTVRDRIVKELTGSDADTSYLALHERLGLLGQMLKAEISLVEVTLLQRSIAEIQHDVLCASLARFMPDTASLSEFRRLDDAFAQVLDIAMRFYTIADRRGNVMARRTLDRMRDAGHDRAILVTGGGHRDQILGVFGAQQVSHSLLMPRWKTSGKDNRRLYADRLLGRKTRFEGFADLTDRMPPPKDAPAR